MKQAGGKAQLPDRARSIIQDVEAKKDMVIFVGSGVDRLPVKSEQYEYSRDGKIIGKKPGVTLFFTGEQTDEFDLNHKGDLAQVEVVREWLDEARDPRIRRFAVSERPAALPRQPFRGFDSFSTNQLLDYVAALAAEEADPDAFIELCIAYEASRDEPREDVIKGLGGVMDSPEDTDVIEAEVTL
jgi:hypothetical protein